MENGLKVRDIAGWLETWAPKALAESYDNVGLLVGHPGDEVTRVLVSLDCTEEVVKEAEEAGCQMIVSHHPVIFGGLKRLQGASDVERTVMRAVRSNIALYAIHTNLDNVLTGVNHQLAKLVGCVPDSLQILRPMGAGLEKWSVFVPEAHAEAVRVAMENARTKLLKEHAADMAAAKATLSSTLDALVTHITDLLDDEVTKTDGSIDGNLATAKRSLARLDSRIADQDARLNVSERRCLCARVVC